MPTAAAAADRDSGGLYRSGTVQVRVCQTAAAGHRPAPDGVKNGSELDTDCGGSCGKCGFGRCVRATRTALAAVCGGQRLMSRADKLPRASDCSAGHRERHPIASIPMGRAGSGLCGAVRHGDGRRRLDAL